MRLTKIRNFVLRIDIWFLLRFQQRSIALALRWWGIDTSFCLVSDYFTSFSKRILLSTHVVVFFNWRSVFSTLLCLNLPALAACKKLWRMKLCKQLVILIKGPQFSSCAFCGLGGHWLMNACLVSQGGFLRGNSTCTCLFKVAPLISARHDFTGILVLAAALCV